MRPNQLQTVADALRDGAKALAPFSDTARLDVEVMMAHRLGVSRSSLLMKHLREPCPPKFAEDVIRRQAHEPVSYIVGFQEFYGLPFAVGPGVLIPRPDSEVLVETSLEIAGESGHVLDLGTGSGALLLAFLANRPGWIGKGIDQSETALEYAAKNAATLELQGRCRFCSASWKAADFATELQPADLVLCNPPYVEATAQLAPNVVDYEPASALFAGPEGLDDYRILIPQIRSCLKESGTAIFEIGATQADAVREIARAHGFDTEVRNDLANRPRAVVLR